MCMKHLLECCFARGVEQVDTLTPKRGLAQRHGELSANREHLVGQLVRQICQTRKVRPVPRHRVMRLDCDDGCWYRIRLPSGLNRRFPMICRYWTNDIGQIGLNMSMNLGRAGGHGVNDEVDALRLGNTDFEQVVRLIGADSRLPDSTGHEGCDGVVFGT